MRRLMVALILLPGCTHDLGNPLELETEKVNLDARRFLQTADFESARDKYSEVLDADPANFEASFGFAITDVLTLPKWKPITDVLDRCYQPTFDVSREIFGPSGVLAREARAAAGTGLIDVYFFPELGSGGTKLNFEPTSVKTEIYEFNPSETSIARNLDITLYDARSAQGGWVSIVLNPDDLTINDGTTVVPFETGVELDFSQLAVEMNVSDPSRLQSADGLYASTAPIEGRLIVRQGGRNPGDTVLIELENVRLPTSCAQAACSASFGIQGMVEDTLTERVDLDQATIPFGDVRADLGSPRRDDWVVALEQCSAIDTDFLAAKAREVGDHLEATAARLAAATRAEPSLTFEIPKELLHARRDLVLSVSDARVLKALLELGAAGLELLGQWRYAEGSLQELLSNYTIWEDPLGMIEPEEVEVRDFEPELVADNLARTFLVRAPEMDLNRVKSRLDRGLTAMTAAFEAEDVPPVGVYDFRAASSRRMFQELASGLSALHRSLDAPEPVVWPEASLFRFHLKQLFTAPIDKDRLLFLTGLPALVRFESGDLQAMRARDRNDRLVFEMDQLVVELDKLFDGRGEDPAVIENWLGLTVDLPPDKTSQACSRASDCGPGYSCTSDQCVADLPWPFTRGAWEQAERDNWPVFINPGVRDALGL